MSDIDFSNLVEFTDTDKRTPRQKGQQNMYKAKGHWMSLVNHIHELHSCLSEEIPENTQKELNSIMRHINSTFASIQAVYPLKKKQKTKSEKIMLDTGVGPARMPVRSADPANNPTIS